MNMLIEHYLQFKSMKRATMSIKMLELINKTLLRYIRKKSPEKKKEKMHFANEKNNIPFPPKLLQNPQNS